MRQHMCISALALAGGIINDIMTSGKLGHDLKYFWLLSRPWNVVITLATFTYAAAMLTAGPAFLDQAGYWWALLWLTIVTGGGYWINDVFDQKTDRINRPGTTIAGIHLSTKKIITAYLISQPVCMLGSFISQPLRVWLLVTACIHLLLLYAWLFKRTSMLGNISIALLTAAVPMYAMLLFGVRIQVIWLGTFAFQINLIREITKDIEDMRGDMRSAMRTLPIRAGIRFTKWLLITLYIVFIASLYAPCIWDITQGKVADTIYAISVTILVAAPAGYLTWRVFKSAHPGDFGRQSLWLKLLMVSGALATAFLQGVWSI